MHTLEDIHQEVVSMQPARMVKAAAYLDSFASDFYELPRTERLALEGALSNLKRALALAAEMYRGRIESVPGGSLYTAEGQPLDLIPGALEANA